MKKIFCLLLSVMMLLCLVACDTDSDDPGKTDNGSTLTATELLALVNEREQDGYGDNVVKVTMDMIADATIAGTNNHIVQKMEMYMKEGTSPVASVKSTVQLPGQDDMITDQYYANGYLYYSANGVTYKSQSLFDKLVGENSMSSGDMRDILNGALENKVEKQSDGTYKVTVKVDPTSENPLITELLEGFGATDSGMSIDAIDAEFLIDADYFLNTIKMDITLSGEMAEVGKVEMQFGVVAAATILGTEYQITVPDSIDIENAVSIDEK